MQDRSLWKAYIALAIVSVVWGTTYFAPVFILRGPAGPGRGDIAGNTEAAGPT